MSCEICGRGNCCKTFHSIEAQTEFDEAADRVKDRMKAVLSNKINQLEGQHIDEVDEDDKVVEKYYISLDEVINIIDEYY